MSRKLKIEKRPDNSLIWSAVIEDNVFELTIEKPSTYLLKLICREVLKSSTNYYTALEIGKHTLGQLTCKQWSSDVLLWWHNQIKVWFAVSLSSLWCLQGLCVLLNFQRKENRIYLTVFFLLISLFYIKVLIIKLLTCRIS